MSWVYRLVGDAVADPRDLDPWLQEEVLDELERLVVAPPVPRPARTRAEVVYDFDRTHAGVRTIVFIRLRVERGKGTLVVLGIASYRSTVPQ